jgi:hypothetical protein
MLQGTPQFTPQQLLEAGRRAEADGQVDAAVQFYRHLTDYYGFTAEAAEARNGLGRMGAAGPYPQIWQSNGAGPHAAGDARSAGPRHPRRVRYPAPRNYYRTGRTLAALFSMLGWLMVVAGLAAPALYLFGPMPPAPYGALGLLGGAIGLLFFGLMIVASGQAARALFDQANATCELVAIERARSGGEHS